MFITINGNVYSYKWKITLKNCELLCCTPETYIILYVKYTSIKKKKMELPLWLSGLRTQLVSLRMQVQSLALISWLGIHCCHELWCSSQIQLRSDLVVADIGLQLQL